MGTFKDITGQRFGKLVVLECYHNSSRVGGRHNATCKCLCDCGTVCIKSKNSLGTGNTKSCGCIRNTLNGKSQHPLYSVWWRMKDRCHKEDHPDYPLYGGRGIKLCDDWLNDYTKFYDWSLANGYEKGLYIDRIDNDKGYSPSNCRWATAIVQANNTSRNVYYECNGECHTEAEWARIAGLKRSTLQGRLRRGWSIEDAISKPLAPKKVSE